MPFYLNLHNALQAARLQAYASKSTGPRVMVVGATDSGKSTLCSILSSYGIREGISAVFVDVDIGQGNISVPGSIAAVKLNPDVIAKTGLGFEFNDPMVMYYGHASPTENKSLYRAHLEKLAERLDAACDDDPTLKSSGYLINTCGWIDGLGYKLILECAQILKVDHFFVIDQERLCHRLTSEVPNTTVVPVPKSGGVVIRDRDFRRTSRNDRIRDYFYGQARHLSPFTLVLDFTDKHGSQPYHIYRVGGGTQAPRHVLPIGAEPTIDPTRCSEVVLSDDLKRSVLGVSWAKTKEDLVTTNVAGFVAVVEVDVELQRLTVLAPCTGELPGKLLLLGTIKYIEDSDT